MTNHWIDIKNADAILIMGSNAAEHHPISFKWVMEAKYKRNAVVMHIDPKFSRTSARSDFHVPLRSGTDIAFLGGMINYILSEKKYFEFYVKEYTNASMIVGKNFKFKDGIFSGYDPKTRTYDKSNWSFELDKNGVPKKDKTLKDPRCVFQLMKKHYSRYDLKKVSDVTGVSKGFAVFGGYLCPSRRGRPQTRDEYPPNSRSVYQGRGRAKNQTDSTQHRRAAPYRY